MAKVQMNESQIVDLIESATRHALSQILSEGAGFDSVKGAFNAGAENGNLADKKTLKSFVKGGSSDGKDKTNYDIFKIAKKDYKAAKNADNKAQKAKKDAEKDYDSAKISNSQLSKAQDIASKTKGERKKTAFDTVSHRPGIVGKAQRAAVVGGAAAGSAVKKVKDAGKNFVHNKIGLEENK